MSLCSASSGGGTFPNTILLHMEELHFSTCSTMKLSFWNSYENNPVVIIYSAFTAFSFSFHVTFLS